MNRFKIPVLQTKVVNPPIDPYLKDLRSKLKATFFSHPAIASQDESMIEKNAGIMSMFANVVTAFQMHSAKAVIHEMINLVDVDDDPDLSSLKAQLLSVPEWETDQSDAST